MRPAGRSALLDGAVHPFEGHVPRLGDRPDRVHGGGVVAGLGEARSPEQAQGLGLLRVARPLQAGHGVGEGAGAAGDPEGALAGLRPGTTGGPRGRARSSRASAISAASQAAVALQEGDRLLVRVEHLGEQEGRLLDPPLRLQPVEGRAVDALQLGVEVRGEVEGRPQELRGSGRRLQVPARATAAAAAGRGAPPRPRRRAGWRSAAPRAGRRPRTARSSCWM